MFGFGKKKSEENIKENANVVVQDASVAFEEPVTFNGCAVEMNDGSSSAITAQNEDKVINLPVEETPPLTWKEERALKKSRYDEVFPKFKTAYLLKNKRTGQIAEIRAASSFHACKLIGWKPNKVKILDAKQVEDPPAETQASDEQKRPA